MARIKRVVLPNIPHHITQRGVRSMNIFFKQEDYEYYKEVLFEQCQNHNLKIISYCLMTNHIHLVVIPSTEESLSRAIGETHRLYTRKINFEQKVRGHLFQERFYSTPLDEYHFFNAIKYVEQNPVKANMVQYPWDYMYSSARHRVGILQSDILLSEHEAIDEIEDYRAFLQETTDEKEIIEKTKTGKPCGDEKFYESILVTTGIDYRSKKPGRKAKKN